MKSDREFIVKICLGISLTVLILSFFLPYWKLRVVAPQYPKGLDITLYLNRVEGDTHEIDILNHYIGMRSLQKAAPLERSIAVPGFIVACLFLLSAVFLRYQFSIFFVIPAVILPTFFALDLY